MNCPLCLDHGLIRVRYHSGDPDQFAVCLCDAGQYLRDDRNAGRHTGSPRWIVWAARTCVDVDQVVMVEDVLSPDELAQIPQATPPAVVDAITATMQTRRPKL